MIGYGQTGQPENLGLVAWSDGEGDWQELVGANGVYSFTADRYGLAWRCNDDGDNIFEIHVIQATRAELAHVEIGCSTFPEAGATTTLSGTVSGSSKAGSQLFTNGAVATALGGPTYSVSVTGSPRDLVVTDPPNNNGVERVIVVPNVTLAGPTTHDFDLATATPLESHEVTVTGDPFLNRRSVTLHTEHGVDARLDNLLQTGDVLMISGAQVGAGDVQEIELVTFDDLDSRRTAKVFFAAPTDLAITYPAALGPVVCDTVGGLVRTAFTPAPAAQVHDISLTEKVTSRIRWFITLTAGFTGTEPVTYVQPDLTSLPGWSTSNDFDEEDFIYASVSSTQLSTGQIQPLLTPYGHRPRLPLVDLPLSALDGVTLLGTQVQTLTSL